MFVVVTLGAADAEAQQRGGNDLDGLGHDGVSRSQLVGGWSRGRPVRNHAQEAGCRKRFDRFGGHVFEGPLHQLVSGELLLDEAIEGFVGVERADDVVSEVVGPGAGRVCFAVAVAVGVAGDVEPVAAPTLPVMRGGQQPFDEAGIGVRRGVGVKGGHFLRCGGQARQIQRSPPQQERLWGFRVEAELFFLELRQHKTVDGSHPRGGGLGAGGARTLEGLKGPELAVLFRDVNRGHLFGLGPGGRGSLRDPVLEELELGGGEFFPLRRHFALLHQSQQFAFVGAAREDCPVGVLPAGLHQKAAQAHVEAALELVALPVAVDTMVFEQGPDVPLEAERLRGCYCANGGGLQGCVEAEARAGKGHVAKRMQQGATAGTGKPGVAFWGWGGGQGGSHWGRLVWSSKDDLRRPASLRENRGGRGISRGGRVRLPCAEGPTSRR